MRSIYNQQKKRTWFLSFIIGLISSAFFAFGWVHLVGLPSFINDKIETILASNGIYASIGNVKFKIFRGITAHDFELFQDEDKTTRFAYLDEVGIGLDHRQLAVGSFKMNDLLLKRCNISISIPDKVSEGFILDSKGRGLELSISDINGRIQIKHNELFYCQKLTGVIAGIPLQLQASILGIRPHHEDKKSPQKNTQLWENIHRALVELDQWSFDPEALPLLEVAIQGDWMKKQDFDVALSFSSKSITKNQYSLLNLNAKLAYKDRQFWIHRCEARDKSGKLNLKAITQAKSWIGKFQITSSIELQELMTNWMTFKLPQGLVVRGNPRLEATGEFDFTNIKEPKLQMIGSAHTSNLKIKDVTFLNAESEFSLNLKDLYLHRVELKHSRGSIKGKFLKKGSVVRMELDTSTPTFVLEPFFINHPLGAVLRDITEQENATITSHIEGGYDQSIPHSWEFKGKAKLTHCSYRNVPVYSAEVNMLLNHDILDFYNGTLKLKYSDYELKNRYGGEDSSTLSVGRIRYEADKKMVLVENVTGKAWPVPLVRLFAAGIAPSLEAYRFHQPPQLTGNGYVDVTGENRTKLNIQFQTNSITEYDFLKKILPLTDARGEVFIRGKVVSVSNLKANIFSGSIDGDLLYSENKTLKGNISASSLSFKALADLYKINQQGGGVINGKTDFEITPNQINTLNGQGEIQLDKAELFSIPMFGPLSSLISTVLRDRRSGYERAKNAKFTCTIKNGVLYSDDFYTYTSSLGFTGEMQVNFNDLNFEMIMRMNARGFFGFLTLPLIPLYGLFQFHGQGSIDSPEWSTTIFTRPKIKKQEELLLKNKN